VQISYFLRSTTLRPLILVSQKQFYPIRKDGESNNDPRRESPVA